MHWLTQQRSWWWGLLTILLQQVAVAFSTYALGLSAKTLSARTDLALDWSIAALIAILSAYCLGIVAQFLKIRTGQAAWRGYRRWMVNQVEGRSELASPENRSKFQHWLGGEARPLLESAPGTLMNMHSAFCNSALNLIALFSLFEKQLIVILSFFFVLSFLCAWWTRIPLKKIASLTQRSKNAELTEQGELWDTAIFLTQTFSKRKLRRADKRLHFYDVCRISALKYEIYGTTSVTMLTLLALCLHLLSFKSRSFAELGVLAISIPRIIQILNQNNQFAAMVANFSALRTKLNALDTFLEQLSCMNFSKQIQLASIETSNSQGAWVKFGSITDLSDYLLAQKNGYFRIKAKNGAGKSSLLKFIKKQTKEALLVSPELLLFEGKQLSTGERQLLTLQQVLQKKPTLLLLDEWSANLDAENREKIQDCLYAYAQQQVVVEATPSAEYNAQYAKPLAASGQS